MPVVVVATLMPIPEHREEVIAALEKAIAQVHENDKGCELYALHEGSDRLVFVEKWASEDDLGAHGSSPALTTLTAELDGKLQGPLDVQLLRPHPAGSAKLGQL